MPQDIPIEASEKHAFTPECFKDIEGAPSFVLRTPTPRDKRMQRRFFIEEGVRSHTVDTIREEVLAGLAALWSPADFEKHSPILKAYWEAQDDFAVQKKAWTEGEPEIEWSYDAEIERACKDLLQVIGQSWPPLRRKIADNAEFGEMRMIVMASVMVRGWAGLPISPEIVGGYLTPDSAALLEEELGKIESRNGIEEGTAWTQLFIDCAKRMYLDDEEVGNSVSPSPSETPPAPSSAVGTPDEDGTSQASATSTETPEIA